MALDKEKQISHDLDVALKVGKEFGFELKHGSVILDFGCGKGRHVMELRKHGYQSFGCDIAVNAEEIVNLNKGIIRAIDLNPYKLPFEDNTFDFIFSFSVFEHVQNYSDTISELSRVLKPNGFCYHFFPSRFRPIEPHTYVPFSSIIQSYWWLYVWAFLGIRNEFEHGLSVKETTIKNYKYLENRTNYLSKNSLRKHFKEHFNNVIFCEQEFLRYTQRGKYIYSLSKIIPFVSGTYSSFRSRIIIASLPQ